MINSFTMRSFKDYVKYRSNVSVLEMAADPIVIKDTKGKERKIVEVRKTPIFMDQDDIDYLKNFPPVLWVQALQKRYGELLHKAHKAKEEGKLFNDSDLSVVVEYRKNILEFKVNNAKINDLYDRLSGDTDDETYGKLRVKDPELQQKYLRGRTHSEKGNRLGPYAFNFSNYTRKKVKTKSGKEKEIGYGDGWVEPDVRTVRRVLGSWLEGIQDGWYDDKVSDQDQVAQIDFQSGIKKKLPVEDQKTWVAGRDFFVKKGKIQQIKSWVPKVFPSVMVPSRKFSKHKRLKRVFELVKNDLEGTRFEDYIQLIDLESPELINQEKLNEILEQINKIKLEKDKSGEDKVEKTSTKKLNEKLARLEKIKIAANYIKNNKNRFEKYLKEEISKVKDDSDDAKTNAVQSAMSKFLSDVSRVTERVLKRLRKNTSRYDVHQWNAAHLNPRETSPQKNWTGIGTMHVNKQQNEKIYSSLVKILGQENVQSFINHIYTDLGLRVSIDSGIRSKLDLTLDSTPTSIKGMFSKSLKESIIDNIEDVTEDASINFLNRIGRSMDNYAKIYKVQVIKNNKTTAELLGNKNALRYANKIKTVANRKGADYCQQLIQLYGRFLTNKYNRTIRPENPWEFKNSTMSFMDVLEYLFNNKEILSKLDPRTSHSINVLEEIAGFVNKDIENDNSKASKEVNRTEDQKSTNKSIFGALVNRLFVGLKGLFGSKPTGQQPTGQQPTGQQPTGQQPTGQQPTGQQPTGQQPTGQQPTGQQPTGQQPTGQQPTGQQPTGQQPTGQQPTGQQPTGQQPTGQQPTGGILGFLRSRKK
jgi:hypothetical protein